MVQRESFFEQAALLEPISKEAASHYAEKLAEMVDRVDELMESVPNLFELIGDHSLEIMFDNHRNHAKFMSNVFHYGNYRLLARIVVWVYRSYHSRGFSFEYFLKALPYWQQAVSENLTINETNEITRVYQWLIDHHGDFVRLAMSPDYVLFSMDSDKKDLEKSLLAFLLHGDDKACSLLAEEVVKSPADLADFYLQILQPCMVEIGNLWESGSISIAHEHLASAIVHRMTSQFYLRYIMRTPSKGKAVITASINEMHDLGARFVGDMLEMDGWQVAFLGANTPREDLMRILREIKPDLLGLSVVVPFNLQDAELTIVEIRKDAELQKIKIMVGGPAFLLVPDLWRQMCADGIATDGAAAVKLGRGWWERRHNGG